jgi:hypothetical protein
MSQPPNPPHAPEPPTGRPGYPPPADQGFGDAPGADQGFGTAPGLPPAPPKRKRSVGKIIAIVVAVVLVICGGSMALGLYFTRDKLKDAVAASKIKVVEPEKLGTRAKSTDAKLTTALDGAEAEMKKQTGVTGTAASFYGDAAKGDLLMVVAASSIGGSAKDRYDEMNSSLGQAFGVKELKDVDAGPLGGIAKCGDGSNGGTPAGVCMWADSGSVAMLVLFNKKGADLEKDFITYRGQIEQKA